jgi:outer membrane protein TolC
MGQNKGNTGNPNGRPKGTQNKSTTELKMWVRGLLEKNTELFENDLATLEPKDRLSVLQGLLKYSIPTLQSVSVEAQLQAEYNQLRILLNEAPEQAIEAISAKILTLKTQSNEKVESE